MLPSIFANMFIQTSDMHNYSTRQADLLYIPFASTKRTQRTIKHFGAKLWNFLCNVLDIDSAFSTFKQHYLQGGWISMQREAAIYLEGGRLLLRGRVATYLGGRLSI